MRHTLLPLNERILLRREYYRRVTIVFCFVLSLTILFGIATLFPIYIKAIAVRSDSEKVMRSVEDESNNKELKEIQKSVARSLTLLDSLDKDKKSVKITDLINSVVYLRNGLKFTGFTASKLSTTTFSMSIQGISPSRNTLLTFKNNFESILPGNKINLPVSELAKNNNFNFSLQLQQKLP